VGETNSVEFCVVGLGNPGREYELSWHNVGFRVVDEIAKRSGVSIRRRNFRALTVETRIDRAEVLLMKPETYMNRSGDAVASACEFHAIAPERVIVAYDDVDLPFGRLRLRRGGRSAGHRGIESISASSVGSDFLRVRLGIGRPEADTDLASFVLSPVPLSQEPDLVELVARAADATEAIVARGVEAAMQEFNSMGAGKQE
jgi:PTH1 family peptidyl-tRNA hydrolase